MKFGNVDKYAHTMRRIGLVPLLMLLPLLKRGITAVQQPPEEIWLSSSIFMTGCCLFFGLWSGAILIAHFRAATEQRERFRMPLPAFGLAFAAPVGAGAWLYASHATGIPLLAFETGVLGACLVLMAAMLAYEGQQLTMQLKQGGSLGEWWRPETPS